MTWSRRGEGAGVQVNAIGCSEQQRARKRGEDERAQQGWSSWREAAWLIGDGRALSTYSMIHDGAPRTASSKKGKEV